MKPLKTAAEIQCEISDLIAEAVAEGDDTRRAALLVMADHWVALLSTKVGQPSPPKG